MVTDNALWFCLSFTLVEEHNVESHDEKAKGEEQKAVIAPLVLSPEQMEEISRKLDSLEDQVKRLQVRMAGYV